MQSTQDLSTSPRSKHIFFLSFRASCYPSVPWFSWNNRNLLLLISNRLVNTAYISAPSVPSSRLLHSAISVSIPISQGFVNASLARSFSCCFLCTCNCSSLFLVAHRSICCRVIVARRDLSHGDLSVIRSPLLSRLQISDVRPDDHPDGL